MNTIIILSPLIFILVLTTWTIIDVQHSKKIEQLTGRLHEKINYLIELTEEQQKRHEPSEQTRPAHEEKEEERQP